MEPSTQQLDLRKLLMKMSNVPYFKKSSKILESQTGQTLWVAALGLTKRALRPVGKGRQALQDSGKGALDVGIAQGDSGPNWPDYRPRN